MKSLLGSLVLMIGLSSVQAWAFLGSGIEVPEGEVGYVKREPWMNPFASGGFAYILKGPAYDKAFWFNYDVILIDVRPSTYTEEFELQTKEDLKIPFRVHFRIQANSERVQEIVEKYSQDWYNRYVKEPLRTAVRTSVEGYTAAELKTQREKISTDITSRTKTILEGTPFDLISVEVGQFLYPGKISAAVEEKLAKEQELEKQQTLFEIQKKQNEIAQLMAEGVTNAQQAMQKGLTPEYLQYLFIQAIKEAADKGNSVYFVPMPNPGQNGMNVVIPTPDAKQTPNVNVPAQR